MDKMSLEQVESELRRCVSSGYTINLFSCQRMADAINAEIKARGEPVAWVSVDHSLPNWFAFVWQNKDEAERRYVAQVSTGDYLDPELIPLYIAPPAPKITNEALVKLARRCLWLAYVWNDHNFDAAHTCARKTAQDVGIKSFDEANTWLQALKETP